MPQGVRDAFLCVRIIHGYTSVITCSAADTKLIWLEILGPCELLWVIYYVFGGVCCECGVGYFLFHFLYQTHSSNKLFLEDMAALKRAFKNYQLLLICWLAVAGYWSSVAAGCFFNWLELRHVDIPKSDIL